jgi:hypothetical protein
MLRLLSGCGAALLAVGTWRGSFGAIFFRASLVDDKRSSTELLAIQAFYGRAAFGIIAHRHECETSRLARFSIGYDLNLRDASKLFEHMLEVSFSDGERNISNVEFHSVMGLYAIVCCRAVPESRVQITIEDPNDDLPRFELEQT